MLRAVCWRAAPTSLRSDTSLKIPAHVRQYLRKLEAYTRDRKRLSELEMQIVVLRALGEPAALLCCLSNTLPGANDALHPVGVKALVMTFQQQPEGKLFAI